jgi:hypothetical protein
MLDAAPGTRHSRARQTPDGQVMRSSVFTAIRRALAIGLGVALPALLAGPAVAVVPAAGRGLI